MNRVIAVITRLRRGDTGRAGRAGRRSRCQRGGAKLLAAGGSTRVVSVRRSPATPRHRERILGCRTTTGRRFMLFHQRDFGLDLIERADIEIVDGRYIGVIPSFESLDL